jgi:hypothetical protein
MNNLIDKATDMELVLYWKFHLDNPCGVNVNGKFETLRESYIHLVKKDILSTLTNSFAREILEETLRKYERTN